LPISWKYNRFRKDIKKNIWHSKDTEKGPETFNGVFAELLNLAAVFNLPVIFMLENNHYAVSTRIECAVGDYNLAGRGSALYR